ncbi:uncharacterized protein LOC115879739 [Sitophilus oryzae]|uniref:NADH dehydrogenase [ubiquinone] 1 beta subcomplex subunit 4 n=1 Tax=Sitophilus oryzae TaxID=7048 RepID=A0A6J2XM17_SITOR|nr:uncharacterized protein LOC115879739 [Sitophilus oryzae]
MSQQYDLPPNQIEILQEKAKRRLFLRNEYLKLKSDPFVHATGAGGHVFDSALQRFHSMSVTAVEHFRPSGLNAFLGFSIMVIPMFTFGYYLNKTRSDREQSFRRGEVAYKDRQYRVLC